MPAETRRVLVLPSWYPTATRPVNGVFVQDQAQALASRYDVRVLAPQLVSWWRDPGAIRRRGTLPMHRDGVQVHDCEVLPPLPRWDAGLHWQYWRASRRALQGLLATWGRPDVIHAHVTLPAGMAAVRLATEFGIPVVLTEHSGPFDVHLRTRAQRARVRRTLTAVDRVVAVSPALADTMKAFCREARYDVIGNVVDTTFFAPASEPPAGRAEESVHFVTIAHLEEAKGIHFLVEAVDALRRRGVHGFRVSIGGDGSQRERLERRVAALGLAEHVRFLGMLRREQVRDAMRGADMFVLPSLGETFGMVVAEAMACGTPVLSTRCGGPEFVVTAGSGVLVPVSDQEALATAMADFIAGRRGYDPAAIRRSIVTRFGRDAFLDRIGALYADVSNLRLHRHAPVAV